MHSIQLKTYIMRILLFLVFTNVSFAISATTAESEENTPPLDMTFELFTKKIIPTHATENLLKNNTPLFSNTSKQNLTRSNLKDHYLDNNNNNNNNNDNINDNNKKTIEGTIVTARLKENKTDNGIDLAKLVIVIDDIGYSKRDLRLMDLPVTLAIIPGSPYANEWAHIAYRNHREVIIHQPMLAKGGRFIEENTLLPDMSFEMVEQIVDNSIKNIPFAVGMNNHTGSEMTSSLEGMQKVFRKLNHTKLFFLDSLTTSDSQITDAAHNEKFQGKLFTRDIFLDNEQNEMYIEKQLDKAILLARKQGFAIAIGHPYKATIHVLERRLPNLPKDIVLVKLSELNIE